MFFLYDFEKELKKYNIDTETYEQILQECSNKVQKISDTDWADIVEKYNLNIHYDSLRKSQQLAPFGGAFVSEYYKWKMSKEQLGENDEYLKKIREEKQEIQKEKRKLLDERLDINRKLRQEARTETTIEKIESALENIGDKRYFSYEPPDIIGEKDMIICLSDLHLGSDFDAFNGYYDTTIAKRRLNDYLKEIVEIQKTHNASNCTVVLLGDLISGNIHKVISVTNKENVIDQVKIACEYIADFIYELGRHFTNVEVKSVSGNHSRIEDKEDALLGDRLDSLIIWFIEKMLKNAENIAVEDENLDDTLAEFYVKDKLYYAVHGDFDGTSDSAIAKLVLWSKLTPYCIICGHKHTPAMFDVQGIKVVQSGSLSGSGDEYTRKKRLSGEPSQTVLVVDDNGIKCHYPIILE